MGAVELDPRVFSSVLSGSIVNGHEVLYEFSFLLVFNKCILLTRFFPWEIRVAFPGESQLRQIRATQPTVHAGCFIVSIIHRTLTGTTVSLTSYNYDLGACVCTRDLGLWSHRKGCEQD